MDGATRKPRTSTTELARASDINRVCGCHWADNEKLTEPIPAGPFHSIVVRQVPAIERSLVASYRPGVAVLVTSTLPIIGIPDMDIVAVPFTVPTSTSIPLDVERNSIMKVF